MLYYDNGQIYLQVCPLSGTVHIALVGLSKDYARHCMILSNIITTVLSTVPVGSYKRVKYNDLYIIKHLI